MMTQFQLFDSVKLKESLSLDEGGIAPEGTSGAIVEIFQDGEAYMVELFGGWIKLDEQGVFITVLASDPNAFQETIGICTAFPHQLRLVTPAKEMVGVRGHLLSILDELSEDLLIQVDEFAESLREKQQQVSSS